MLQVQGNPGEILAQECSYEVPFSFNIRLYDEKKNTVQQLVDLLDISICEVLVLHVTSGPTVDRALVQYGVTFMW